MRHRASASLIAALSVLVLTGTGVQAHHAEGPRTCIRIVTAAFTGGPGDESVRLRNVCDWGKDVSAWTLENDRAETYRIPSGTRIPPRRNLTIHVGPGTNRTGHRYWRRTSEAFLDGDRAVVRTAHGREASAFAPSRDRWLSGAGDIALCDSDRDEATASILDGLPGWVFTAGDNVQRKGTAAEFADCYEPTWGRHRSRTFPAIGNHEYQTGPPDPYFDYFGSVAGERGKGWYSYDLGAWHIVVLNAVCFHVACGEGSEQERWLREDLARHPADCTLAMWHYPRFTSFRTGDGDGYSHAFWRALYEAGADVVIQGHHHHYERLGPMRPNGALDTARGLRSFIVGTGGAEQYWLETPHPNSEVADATTYGILGLTLRPHGYSWRFHPVEGATFTDSGAATCH